MGFRADVRQHFRGGLSSYAIDSRFECFMLASAFWILATVPMRFGFPWSQVSFASGYGAIVMSAITVMKILGLEPGEIERSLSFRAAPSKSSREGLIGARLVKPCTTCALFAEFTTDFSDIVPKEEAIYLEHLKREHDLDP